MMDEAKAKELVAQKAQVSLEQLHAELTWQPGEISESPHRPYWRVTFEQQKNEEKESD